jgi:hypothetical protein
LNGFPKSLTLSVSIFNVKPIKDNKMSATRSQWAWIIEQVMRLIYEQDDTYMGMEYKGDADEDIKNRIAKWTVTEFDHYIAENFTPADLLNNAVQCAGSATCASEQ